MLSKSLRLFVVFLLLKFALNHISFVNTYDINENQFKFYGARGTSLFNSSSTRQQLSTSQNSPEIAKKNVRTSTTNKPNNNNSRQQVDVRNQINSANNNNVSSARSGRRILQNDDYEQADDTRIPLWNIAHMINSIDQIEPVLMAGANGIEVDVSFNKRGYPAEAYHGFPCDCGRHCHHREDFVKFMQHISNITFPYGNSNLQVILLDLKLKDLNGEQKREAGSYLASIIDKHLYKRYSKRINNNNQSRGHIIQPPVRVVVSINHFTDVMLIQSFINYMRQNRLDFMALQVGFDVGMNDNLTDISEMWNSLKGSTFNIWQGDGLTNCANIIRGIDRLKDAINYRNEQGHFRKVYYWTADVMYQIRSVLRLGLDAILTNQPQRVVQVISEPEFNGKYRLALPYDNPFAQFKIQPSAWQMSAPTISEAVETVSNIRETSVNFVKTLPEGLDAMLKKVHKSIASTF